MLHGLLQPAIENDVPMADGDPLGGALSFLVLPLVVLTLGWVWTRRHHLGNGVRALAFGAAIGNALFEFNAHFEPQRPSVEVIVQMEQAALGSAQVGQWLPKSGMAPAARATAHRATTADRDDADLARPLL